MFASKDLFLTQPAGATGYQISRSVRTRSSATAYFNRTFGTPTNQKIWTWSGWLKRGTLANGWFFGAGGTTNPREGFQFLSDNTLDYTTNTGGAIIYEITTTQVFRDTSAWYHIIIAFDSTQATASNRIKLYVNGTQVTALSVASYPSLNANPQFINSSGTIHNISALPNGAGSPFDGYLTEINFIDGQALTPSSFGTTNATTGVWQPAKYTGTYGNNGFYLNFSDNSSNTATTIGKDYSGNGNNWTPNNISVTAGTTYDSMVDTPTPYGSDTGAGGEVRGNYAVLNPISNPNSPLYTVSNGNLTYSCSSSAGNAGRMSIAGTTLLGTGKTYWEATPTDTNGNFGICYFKNQAFDVNSANPGGTSYVAVSSSGAVNANAGTLTYTGSAFSYVANDVIGFAYDGTANSLAFYKNGSLIGTYTGINAGPWLPGITVNTGGAATNFSINFGQRAFAYQNPGTNRPDATYKALCTQNLSTPTIANGASYMAATTYTGNGGTQTVANSGSFAPDFVWVKNRGTAGTDHGLFDTVRGATKRLASNLTNAETTEVSSLTAFTSTGFTVGTAQDFNQNGVALVGWQWKAGGSSSSNGNGSITSTVSVNQTAGFSVVTYTGTGVAATVGHGIGVAPNMVIVKRRNSTGSWPVYHSSLPSANYELFLERTDAQGTPSNSWNNTAPTPTVFSIGTGTAVNTNTGTYVAYLWAAVAGYSAFGSYTGNGSTDGPFVYLGFRPRFVMFKRTDSTGNWDMIDTSRSPYNQTQNWLYANLSNAADDASSLAIDFNSNGFKVRSTNNDVNISSATYVYAAFAENPFKFSLAR